LEESFWQKSRRRKKSWNKEHFHFEGKIEPMKVKSQLRGLKRKKKNNRAVYLHMYVHTYINEQSLI
jgi:hypothetical protein